MGPFAVVVIQFSRIVLRLSYIENPAVRVPRRAGAHRHGQAAEDQAARAVLGGNGPQGPLTAGSPVSRRLIREVAAAGLQEPFIGAADAQESRS